jgi:hypothetical protein
MAAAIFVATPFIAFAETDEPRGQTPKPTIEEAQKLIQTISGDASPQYGRVRTNRQALISSSLGIGDSPMCREY